MRELILGGLHLFFFFSLSISLYFCISASWHFLCSLLIFTLPQSHSLLVVLSSVSVNSHPYLHLFFQSSIFFCCWIPHFPGSLSFSLSSFSLPLHLSDSVRDLWVYDARFCTHLSAHSFCFFSLFFFLFFLFFSFFAQLCFEMCVDAYRIFTFDLCMVCSEM